MTFIERQTDTEKEAWTPHIVNLRSSSLEDELMGGFGFRNPKVMRKQGPSRLDGALRSSRGAMGRDRKVFKKQVKQDC